MKIKGPLNVIYFEKGNSDSFKTVTIDNVKDFTGVPETFHNVKEIDFQALFNFSDYAVDIYEPLNEDCTDFIIDYLAKNKDDDSLRGENLEKFSGCLLSELLPIYFELGFVNSLKKVYQEDITVNFKLIVQDLNDNLVLSYEAKLFKIQGLIYALYTHEDVNNSFINDEFKEFYQFNLASAISQDYMFIKKNQKFVDLEKMYSISPLTFEDMSFKGVSNSEWLKIYDNIIKGEVLSYSGEVKFETDKGSPCYFIAYLSPEFHNGKLAVKFNFSDITSFNKTVEQGKILHDNLVVCQKLNKFALLHGDNRGFFGWDDEIYNILEFDSEEVEKIPQGYNIFDEYMNDDDREIFDGLLNGDCDFLHEKTFKIRTHKGNVKYLVIYSFAQVSEYDPSYRWIVTCVQDVTDIILIRKQLEENSDKIKKAIGEKEILLKEVHHRVKNNLQLIVSLLNIDLHFNKDDPESTIWNTIDRINSMALIHDKTYQSGNLESANVKDYIVTQASQIFNLYGTNNIKLITDIEDIELDMDIIIPLGLMINELILNTIKYAFPGDSKGYLSIKLKRSDEGMFLNVCDDGVGLPDDLDINSSNSLGMTILQNLTSQIGGELIDLKPSKGSSILIKFPLNLNTD